MQSILICPRGFPLGSEGLVVSHVQYADCTLCIGETFVENLWTLKALLTCFEMVFRLKVDFYKSCLTWMNLGKEFMERVCDFLNCYEGTIPFNYLRLPVGANSSKLSTWEPLLKVRLSF